MKDFTFRGKTQSLPAWSRELGIPENTLRSRLVKLGMSVEEAFSRPVATKFRPIPAHVGPKPIKPAPRLGKYSDGRACVRWVEGTRRRIRYFGRYGTAECRQAYARFCSEWYANQGTPAPPVGEPISVAGLILRFLDYAEATFRKRGKITSEVHGIRSALARLNQFFGDTEANEFGPERLRALQSEMEREGLSLSSITAYRNKVTRCFSWGVSRQLIPAAVADALLHAESLIPGRTSAALQVKTSAAPEEDIAKILPILHADPARCAILGAMVQLQQFTGMRPGEVCELCPEQIDRTRTPWLYTPPKHKTLHLGGERRVWIGPKARAILEPMLATAEVGQPVFRMKRRQGKGLRAVPMEFLRSCLATACKAAKVPIIKPNQLRHAHGTRVQRTYEDDAAVATALGNTPEVARQVYVDHPADAVGKRIAEELG